MKYPKYLGWAGFLSMAVFRIPMLLNRKLSFWKLLGSGKNGSFDIHPDWRQWGILAVLKPGTMFTPQEELLIKNFYGKFIVGWLKFFRCKIYTALLEPIEGHGTWDNKEVFGDLPKQSGYDGRIAVLTRATIKINKLHRFWKYARIVAGAMNQIEGFETSVGIGEIPWIKQATFSIWTDINAMKNFAYKLNEHKDVIRLTRQENWYKEEMFVRFKVCYAFGRLPLL